MLLRVEQTRPRINCNGCNHSKSLYKKCLMVRYKDIIRVRVDGISEVAVLPVLQASPDRQHDVQVRVVNPNLSLRQP